MGCCSSITVPPEEALGTWSNNNDRFVSIYPDGMFQEVSFVNARTTFERSGPTTRWDTTAGVSTIESNPCCCCGCVINDVEIDTSGRLLWDGAILLREPGQPRSIVRGNRKKGGYISRGYRPKESHPAWRDRRNAQ